jgi:predicted enzyme related to lactoylglutathione lyase
MQVEQFVTSVNSEQPEAMIAFYRNKVGLSVNPEFGPGAFMAGSSDFIALIIEGHDAVKGRAKEPERIMLNFMVADVVAEQKRLEGLGVTFVRNAAEEPGFGIVATFADPDGNYCQLMQMTE